MNRRHLFVSALVSAFTTAAAQRTPRTQAPPATARPIADASGAANPDSGVWQGLEFRNIGPSATSGRVADVEGVPGNPNVVYVGSASGGVWKTTNGGVTFKPIFDKQPVLSIGDIALEPGNPDVVYVGTGEGAPRNSVSFGNGIYKSTDGGATWKHLGLTTSERITRILVSPRNPQTVYAGVLGHVFGPNPDRGVYMSTNGGESWEKVLYVDEQHGVADMDLDPKNPNIVYATMWKFERKPWTHISGSELGGVFKSIDGGRTWKKLTSGLPKLLGRTAVKVSPANPDVVYVLAESNDGTFFRSTDKGETFTQMNKDVGIVNRGFYFTQLRADPVDENRVYAIAGNLFSSIDGGKTFKQISQATHVDFHSLWIDPLSPSRIWQGQDGGTAVSYDRGETWESLHTIPLSQLYAIYADRRAPFYHLGGGLQDNGTWTGPSRTREPLGIMNDDWRMISFGDGFQIQVHPDDPDVFLSENQGGGLFRTNMRTREQVDASPQPRRNDGGPVKDLTYRFNWNSPVIQSPHDGKTVYFAGNVVFRTTTFGTGAWEQISPDLTKNEPEKQGAPGGPVWHENTTAEYHPTIISFAESPVERGVLWAGTDDGNLQVSRDAGRSWTDLTRGGPAVPPYSPVSHIEPSRANPGTMYVAYDRHMFDDFKGYVFRSADAGRTWANVSDNLPHGAYVHVVREDPVNPRLVYAGTELGLFASYNGGGTWRKLHLKNLPAVAVHDIMVHPVMNDLILATHGRGVWILDDATPVQRVGANAAKGPELFDVRPAWRYTMRETRFMIGNKYYLGTNPPYGALVTYFLPEKPDSAAPFKLEVLDAAGSVVREIKNPPRAQGMNRAAWDLAYDPPRARRDSTGPGEGGFFGPPRGPQAVPGSYAIRLTLGGAKLEKPVEVKLDPDVETTVADLKQQFETAVKLRDMRTALNDTLRAVDVYRAGLAGRRGVVAAMRSDAKGDQLKEIDREIADVDSLLARLTVPPGRTFWSEGPRISERLGQLFNGIDGPNHLPTPHQMKLYGELEKEWRDALLLVASKLSKTISRGPEPPREPPPL